MERLKKADEISAVVCSFWYNAAEFESLFWGIFLQHPTVLGQ